MRARRHDRSRLGKADPGPGGARLIPAYVTSVGVYAYKQTDGRTLREFRPPEEVFAPVALASLHLAPVTLDHPEAMVDASTWRTHAIGVVADPPVPAEDAFVSTRLLVSDASALARFDAPPDDPERLEECSCGYEAEIEETPGTWEGQPYDVIQREIRYNHVALGPPGWGRHGPDVSVRLDAAEEIDMKVKRHAGDPPAPDDVKEDAVPTMEALAAMSPEELSTLKRMIAEVEAAANPVADAPVAVAPAPAPTPAAPAPAPASTTPTGETVITIAAKADAAEAKIRTLEAQIAAMPETLRAHDGVRTKAQALGVRVDGRDLRAIMIDAIKATDPAFEAKGKTATGVDRSTDAFIAARFDAIEIRTDFSRPLPSELARGSSTRCSSDDARDRMQARQRRAW